MKHINDMTYDEIMAAIDRAVQVVVERFHGPGAADAGDASQAADTSLDPPDAPPGLGGGGPPRA